MKIGILGAGAVAQTLAAGFLKNGHEVMLGTRDSSKIADWLSGAGRGASTGSFAEAAQFGDIVFLSVNQNVIDSAIELAGSENLIGKTVVDLTNPMDFSQGIPPRFTVAYGDSLGEKVQRALPGSNVVKAFNSMGANIMTDPLFDGVPGTHFIAGNNAAAKAEVKQIAEEFGWEVVDAGEIGQAFFLEALASLWVNYSIKSGQREQAFKLLSR